MQSTSQATTAANIQPNSIQQKQAALSACGSASRTMEREDWNQRYAAEELIWTAKANRFLMEETAHLTPGSALDMATGEGRNAVWLAEQGWIVRAVDFSDVAIAKARRLAMARNVHEAIDFREADLRTYDLDFHRFDLVALIYLQIPQAELLLILLRAARAVAPGGTFLLVGHDSENLLHGYGGPQRADMLYTAEQVVAALGNELVIEKAGRIERPVETPDGIRVALDCLVRGKRL
jgi:ubiquinone/menaquinone biosynthesis C-methylase UbiE